MSTSPPIRERPSRSLPGPSARSTRSMAWVSLTIARCELDVVYISARGRGPPCRGDRIAAGRNWAPSVPPANRQMVICISRSRRTGMSIPVRYHQPTWDYGRGRHQRRLRAVIELPSPPVPAAMLAGLGPFDRLRPLGSSSGPPAATWQGVVGPTHPAVVAVDAEAHCLHHCIPKGRRQKFAVRRVLVGRTVARCQQTR